MLSTQDKETCLQRIRNCIVNDRPIRNWLIVSTSQQTLFLLNEQEFVKNYPVSTSRFGIGNQEGSYKTPLGVHSVAKKIGASEPVRMIFEARKPTGKLAILNNKESTDKDFITSRILWLTGEERGLNKGGEIDSYRRYIYIHGTADELSIGKPASIGCIRMKNNDVIELFDQVSESTPVVII